MPAFLTKGWWQLKQTLEISALSWYRASPDSPSRLRALPKWKLVFDKKSSIQWISIHEIIMFPLSSKSLNLEAVWYHRPSLHGTVAKARVSMKNPDKATYPITKYSSPFTVSLAAHWRSEILMKSLKIIHLFSNFPHTPSLWKCSLFSRCFLHTDLIFPLAACDSRAIVGRPNNHVASCR